MNQKNSDNIKLNGITGSEGRCVSELFPSGEVEVNGKRYDAKSNLGKIHKGEKIRVLKSADFELIVEKVNQ